MKILLFAFATSILFLTSCNSGGSKLMDELSNISSGPTALEYNDSIIAAQNRIIEKFLAFGQSFDGGMDQAESIRQETIKVCEASIKTVSSMKPYEGDNSLRQAALDLFKFYKEVSSNEFKQLQDILMKDDIGMDDLTEMDEINKQISEKETVFDEKLKAAQETFAAKHGFMIESKNKYQDQMDELSGEY